jgi:hypothetical protein
MDMYILSICATADIYLVKITSAIIMYAIFVLRKMNEANHRPTELLVSEQTLKCLSSIWDTILEIYIEHDRTQGN